MARIHRGRLSLVFVFPTFLNAQAVLQVKGRFLYDKNGEKVIIRGIEHVINYGGWKVDQNGSMLADIARTGANSVRILGGTNVTPAMLEDMLHRCTKEYEMWVNLAHFDWNNAAMRDVMKKYEDYLILHAQGEVETWEESGWSGVCRATIDQFRGWGFKCPLDLMANGYGQNWNVVKVQGADVFKYDPEKNVIFGIQLYSQYSDRIPATLDEVVAFGYPVQVGACLYKEFLGVSWAKHTAESYKEVWEETWKRELGCMYWCWYGDAGKDEMTSTGKYGDWTPVGTYLCNTSPGSFAKTSFKTAFLTSGQITGAFASFTSDKTQGPPPLTVGFDAGKSKGENLSYSWNFGDGANATGSVVQHTFTTPGDYTVTLTVTAKGGASDNATRTITVFKAGENKLTGTVIGTEGSWENSGNTRDKVFDGNTGTFFDAPVGNGTWVGLILQQPTVITRIRFHGRSGQEGRMNNGVFEGSSSADFSNPVRLGAIGITQPGWNEISVSSSTAVRYVRYVAPDGGYGNVAEIEFYGISDRPVANRAGATPINHAHLKPLHAHFNLRGQRLSVQSAAVLTGAHVTVSRTGAVEVRVNMKSNRP